MWIFFVFFLASIEFRAVKADHKDSEKRAQALADVTNATLGKTDSTLQRVQETLDTEKQTQGNVSLLGSRLDSLTLGINLAKQKNDAATVALLERQRATIQRDVLRTTAPGIAKELRFWGDKWADEDNDLEKKVYTLHNQNRPQQEVDEVNKARQNLREHYSAELRPLWMSANFVRGQLLANAKMTDGDRAEATVFDKAVAGQPISWTEFRNAGYYLDELVKKAFPPDDKP
jgi:hypothetical protein